MSTITEKIVKSNYKFMIEKYASASEVVDDCKSRPITSSSFYDMQEKSLDEDWHAVKTYDEALEYMRTGYQPTVDELKNRLNGKVVGNGKRVTFKNNVAGFAPIVPLAMMGVPNSMIDTRMKPIKCKVLDIYYDMTCTSDVDQEDIIKNGQKMLGAVLDLESQGYRFNLYAVQAYTNHESCDMIVVKVKSSNQPLDLKRISFPFTHTAFFRVIGFDWYSKTPRGTYRSGYGHNLSREFNNKEMDKIAIELFGNNAIYFSGSEILKKDEEYIKEVLQNAGNRKLGKM